MDPTYNMDVDDLFGDSENVTLQAINATPPVKGLARRVDDLSASNCCQKIAWSKSGCLAYISPDGYSINLKAFYRDIATGKWDLDKDVPVEIPSGRDDYPFVHLSWSHLGNELGVVDAAGRVSIFSCARALNHTQFVRTEMSQPETEADGVVGLHWLAIFPYESKMQIVWSAARNGNKWKWNIRSHIFQNPHHPIDKKTSLVYVKKFGDLRLRFQQNDNSWHETSVPLRPIISASEPFTHAAFAPNDDNSLLLATYNVAGCLHLYRAEITWNVPQEKRSPNSGHFDKPSIQVSLLHVEENCSPASLTTEGLNDGGMSGTASHAQLTHLRFLPVTPGQNDGSVPTIQAIFCRPPTLVAVDQLQPQETPYSVIVRWEVHKAQQNQLHPSLDQVTSKKKAVGSVSSRPVVQLKRQMDFNLHTVVLACYPIWFHMLLIFYYSDGTVEFRKRSTLEPILPDGNTDLTTSFAQAGFVYTHAEPSLHITFSPNHCIAAGMQQDGTIKIRSMEYQHGTLSEDDEDPRHSAALAELALQLASAANSYQCSDDIFSIIGPLSEQRREAFMTLLFESLQINLDPGIEDNNNNQSLTAVTRSSFFIKTLSAAHIFGLQGPITRSLPSKIAWQILNMKYISEHLNNIWRIHSAEKSLLRPDFVPYVTGIARWCMHYIAYLLDDLFALGRAVQRLTPTTEITLDALNTITATHLKPTLHLLLSASSRSLLKQWVQPLVWIKRSAESYTNLAVPTSTPELPRLYAPLHAALNEIPFDYRWFDALLNETAHLARSVYKKDDLSDVQRAECERSLLLGRIPEPLFFIAKRLVTDALWNSGTQGGCLADKLDSGRLMFFDTMWLGLQESRRAEGWWRGRVVDVCQKVVIRGKGKSIGTAINSSANINRNGHVNGMGQDNGNGNGEVAKKAYLRRCPRCSAYMEDVTPGLAGYTAYHLNWLATVAKHCVCGNSWMLVEDRKGL